MPGVVKVAEAIKAEAASNIRNTAVLPDRGLTAGLNLDINVARRQVRVVSTHPEPNVPLWQHDGTGVHGPKRTPIRPKSGKLLAWKDRTTGEWIFAKEVKGSPARKYLSLAAATVARAPGITYRPQ